MTLRPRRAVPGAAPQWEIRYQLAITGEATREFYETKQQARDRYFTVKEFRGLDFVELREPGGRLWFRDHYFSK